jgi:hypothetical protein
MTAGSQESLLMKRRLAVRSEIDNKCIRQTYAFIGEEILGVFFLFDGAI